MPRALLIERSATLRHLLGSHLEHAGYQIDAVTGYAEGIARLEEGGYEAVVVGWPPKTDPGCDELLALLEEPGLRRVAVLLVAHDHDPSLSTWVMRRQRATALLWDYYREAGATLATLIDSPVGEDSDPHTLPPQDVRIRILFVDDSPSVRVYFRRLLARHGYVTEVASCGEEALEMAEAKSYDIAIVDYFMPDTKGDEVCRRLRDNPATSAITCAIITGTYLDQVIKDTLAAGAVECMFKNESDALFLARVDAMSRLIRTQKSIEAERERLAGILSSVGEGVYGVDRQGRITFVNPAACRILGYEQSHELVGQPAHARFHYANRDGAALPPENCALNRAYGRGEQVRCWETVFWHLRGEPIPVECTVYPLHIQQRREGSVVAFRDISERKRLEEKLRWQAMHDPLTELVNRRYFEEELEREVYRLRRTREQAALLYIDLDRFKYVNDTLGHTAGDELLIEVGHQLRERLRESDLLARLGGDEFAVLLRDVDEDDIFAVAEGYRNMLERCSFNYEGRQYNVNGSIGVAAFDHTAGSPGEVLANADVACHLAKRKGRNQTHVYAKDQDERTAMDLELGWSSRLREGLDYDRFILHYQPIAPLPEVRGSDHEGQPRDWALARGWPGNQGPFYEVLLRLIGEHNEPIAPDAFLPSAERFNLMEEIDRWVLREALAGLAQLHSVDCPVSFAINLSGPTLNDQRLHGYIKELLEHYALDPRYLVFEITETAAIANIRAAQTFIAAMRELGCRFALDDFGSGFSSFSHLKHLPADYIKIDGLFVQGMARDPIDRAMVGSINEIAHSLGRQTIAEYVETREVADLLSAAGVDFIQGDYVSRPLAHLAAATGMQRSVSES